MTRERFEAVVYALATFAVLLLAWEAAIRFFDVPTYFIPAPSAIVAALIRGRDLYPYHFLVTLYSTLMAFALAFILAVVLGALINEVQFLERTIYPVIIAFQSIPRIALAPIIIVWFGFGASSKIILGVISAFFPIFLNTLHGLKVVDNDQIALMRTLEGTRMQIFWKIKMPNALPFLLAGANIGIIFAILAVIVGEFLGSNTGMGFLIVNQANLMDTAGVFATVLLLSMAGVFFHYGIQYGRFRLLFWIRQSDRSNDGRS